MKAASKTKQVSGSVDHVDAFPAGKLGEPKPELYSDPAATAALFVKHRAMSAKEDISAGLTLSKGISAVRGNNAKISQLLAELGKAKLISSKEQKLGFAAKKTSISMYAKIAQYADVLLDEKILPMLSTGYTTLYQAANLYEDIEGHGKSNPIEGFYEVLKSSDGPITKRFLIQQRDIINGRPPDDGVEAATEYVALQEPSTTDDPAAPVDATVFSVLLASPSAADVQRLMKSYPTEFPLCLRIHEQRAETALLVVQARLKDVLAIADKLPCWGFARLERIYLIASPQSPEIADAEVLAVSHWGNTQLPEVEGWPATSNAFDLVDRLATNFVGKKLHLFARDRRDRWDSIVGEENWAVEETTHD